MRHWLAKRNGERFVRKSREVHGDLYKYDVDDYKGALVKTKIICDTHGPFHQRPSDHLAGAGCPKCRGRGFSPEERIEQLREERGDEYDLSEAVYSRSGCKIKVICRKHGEFFPTYNNFKKGQNCKACVREAHPDKIRKPLSEYLDEAMKIHGDKFEYSDIIYNGVTSPLTIKCKQHGVFTTEARHHLTSKYGGCNECFRESVSERKVSNTAEFIEKARLIHENFYDYSKVEYELNYINVVVTCPKHGDFVISPASHLKGGGCQHCSKEKLAYSWMKEDYCAKFPYTTLYLIRFYNKDFSTLKVGISVNVDSRIKGICKSLGCGYDVIREISGKSEELWELEKSIHTDTKLRRHSWGDLVFGGHTEFYSTKEEDRIIRIFDCFGKAAEMRYE